MSYKETEKEEMKERHEIEDDEHTRVNIVSPDFDITKVNESLWMHA